MVLVVQVRNNCVHLTSTVHIDRIVRYFQPENFRLHFDSNFRLLHKQPAGLAVFPLLISSKKTILTTLARSHAIWFIHGVILFLVREGISQTRCARKIFPHALLSVTVTTAFQVFNLFCDMSLVL